ncbi:MAG: ankyrin repeat domain-containing protein, partial [Steroidobacteraceae bacterium]
SDPGPRSLYVDPFAIGPQAKRPASPHQSGASDTPPAGPIPTVKADAVPALVTAARDQKPAVALELVRKGANVNATGPDRTTALMWAVHYDEVPLVEQLLARHASVRTQNAYGATAMSEAAIFGDTQVIEDLVRAGASVESANHDGMTALMVIARTDNVAAARFLIRHGADVNARGKIFGQTALDWAAARSEPQMVRVLLRYHANPNVRTHFDLFRRQITAEPRIQARPIGGFTPLIYAAREGCTECVKSLLQGGARVDMTDPDGETPLLVATENFHFDCAAYLLAHGANPSRWDWWGRTPLYAAVDLDTLPYGGRPDHVSLDHTTALQLIRMLLDRGANPNAQLKLFPPYRSLGADRGGDMELTEGTTPLARAARGADLAAIKLLVAHGAVVGLPNERGDTPLMLAAGLTASKVDTRGRYRTQAQALATVKLLVAAGGKVNRTDGRGETALFGAAALGWNDVVRSLVADHADIGIKDRRGMTAIDAAMGRTAFFRRGTPNVHQDTVNLLRQLTIASTAAPSNLLKLTR